VPSLLIVPTIVSGVLSPTPLRNPLTFLRRRKEDREWLAATIQMLTPGLYDVGVRVEFGRPVSAGNSLESTVSQAVLEEARLLIERCGIR
jgi:hypothetical protein